MNLPLDFHPYVRADTNDGYSWYEARRTGLGTAFLDAVQATLDAIERNPALYGYVEDDVRAAPVRRYPYVVYYRIRPDRVAVLAVYHTSRDPHRLAVAHPTPGLIVRREYWEGWHNSDGREGADRRFLSARACCPVGSELESTVPPIPA